MACRESGCVVRLLGGGGSGGWTASVVPFDDTDMEKAEDGRRRGGHWGAWPCWDRDLP